MNTELKPLLKVKEMIDDVELEITYEYDDLVFVQHNPFLLRFDLEDAANLYLHFNTECEIEASEQLTNRLTHSAKTNGLNLIVDKKYNMLADEENDNIQIQFE